MPESIPEVLIDADAYDAALAFCNERRAEAELRPWAEMPAGRGSVSTECPCAKSVPGLSVGNDSWSIESSIDRPYRGGLVPKGVKQFVFMFDSAAGHRKLAKPIRRPVS